MPRSMCPFVVSRRPPPLGVLLFAACGGILIDRLLPVPPGCWWLLSILGLAAWSRLTQTLPKTGLTCLLLAVSGVAASWHHARWHLFPVEHYVRYAPPNDQLSIPIRIVGVVGSAPRVIPADDTRPDPLAAGDRSRFLLHVQQIGSRPGIPVAGWTTVTVRGHLLGVQVGDRVSVDGRLRARRGPMNPGQQDARLHFRGIRQLGVINAPYPDSVIVLRRGTRPLQHWPAQVRARAESILQQHVASDQYGLAAALLLGARQSLKPSVLDAFFRTGTIHLLAVSGLHVGILACALLAAARGRVLPWRPALYAVMVLTLAYAMLTESRAPVVRASLLIQIVCASWIIRRRLSPMCSLSAAGLIVLALNPSELFSSGTQLSFLAVATLGFVGSRLSWQRRPTDPIDRLIWKSRSALWRFTQCLMLSLKQMTIASLAVWLVTLPLVTYRFHLLSPWSVPLNLVLWIPVAVALFTGLGIFAFHGWLPQIADVSGQICSTSLRLLQHTVQFIESLPASHFWVIGPTALWVSLFYLATGLTAWSPTLRCSWRWWTVLVIAGVSLPVAEGQLQGARTAQRVRCTILSVGHGNCVFIEFPNGFTVLYDAGRIGTTRPAVETVSRFLWSRRVRRIDAVVVSHADADHFNLLPDLLHRFRVTTLYTNPRPSIDDSLSPLLAGAKRAGVQLRQWSDGNELTPSADCRIRVLHPPANRLRDTDNANSLVLVIESAGRRILLPGDLEGDGLLRLLKKEPIDVDLAMAPHHGSPNSLPAEFAAWCSPEWIVISGSKLESSAQLRNSLCNQVRLLHTAEVGAVEVLLASNYFEVAGFRERASTFGQSE